MHCLGNFCFIWKLHARITCSSWVQSLPLFGPFPLPPSHERLSTFLNCSCFFVPTSPPRREKKKEKGHCSSYLSLPIAGVGKLAASNLNLSASTAYRILRSALAFHLGRYPVRNTVPPSESYLTPPAPACRHCIDSQPCTVHSARTLAEPQRQPKTKNCGCGCGFFSTPALLTGV